MTRLQSWLRYASERSSRFRTAPGVAAVLLVLCTCVAALLTYFPGFGSLLAGIAAAILCSEYVLPAAEGLTFPLLVLFLTPADGIIALSEDRRGFFVLIVGTLLGVTAVAFGRFRLRSRMQLLLPAVAGMYLAVLAVHISKGEMRSAMFWVAAAGLWVWLAGRVELDPASARRGMTNAILAIGSINGTIALMEFIGISDPTRWIPGYEPSQDLFSEQIGRRAVGLAWHALPFGTLCMLGCALAICELVKTLRRRQRPTWLVVSLLSCGAGLVLSGARGSWLALVIALSVGLASVMKSRRSSSLAVIRALPIIAVVAGLLVATNLGIVVYERLFGTAIAPQSIGQRVAAIESIVESLPELPLMGVGPGGAPDLLLRSGLTVPNIENEYLIALVTGGPVALLLLVAFVVVLVRVAYRRALATQDPGPLTLAVALCINMGTFNMFSWSAGPALLSLITCFAVLVPDDPVDLDALQ